jgi:hypothetical protein
MQAFWIWDPQGHRVCVHILFHGIEIKCDKVLWRNGHNMWILQCKNVDQRTVDKVEQQELTIHIGR